MRSAGRDRIGKSGNRQSFKQSTRSSPERIDRGNPTLLDQRMAPAGPAVAHKKNLTRKVCIVTGAASGFGEAISRQLAARGAIVVLADKDAERGEKLAKELDTTYGGELDIGFFPFVQADLSTFEGTKKVFDECMKRFATVDIVILNAGIGDGDKFFFDEKNPDNTAWKTMVDVNVNAVVYGTQLAMAEFREMNKPGTIVITASIGSFHAVKSLPVYVGTKSFVYNFARSVSKLLPKVRVHTVHPGAVNTPLARSSFTTIPGADELGKANEHELGILVPDDVADGMMYAIENDDLESGASIRVAWRGTDLVRTKVEQFRKIKDPRKLEAKAKI